MIENSLLHVARVAEVVEADHARNCRRRNGRDRSSTIADDQGADLFGPGAVTGSHLHLKTQKCNLNHLNYPILYKSLFE